MKIYEVKAEVKHEDFPDRTRIVRYGIATSSLQRAIFLCKEECGDSFVRLIEAFFESDRSDKNLTERDIDKARQNAIQNNTIIFGE